MQVLYQARLDRKVIFNRVRGVNGDGSAKFGGSNPVSHEMKEWKSTDGKTMEQVESRTKMAVGQAPLPDPDQVAAAVVTLKAGLKTRGFANAAEAFAFLDADGEQFITEFELTKGLRLLRLEVAVGADALMVAAEEGGCRDGKIEYREFLRHFSWREGRVTGDAEKALYEAKLDRKKIVQRVEATLAAEGKKIHTRWAVCAIYVIHARVLIFRVCLLLDAQLLQKPLGPKPS